MTTCPWKRPNSTSLGNMAHADHRMAVERGCVWPTPGSPRQQMFLNVEHQALAQPAASAS